jgi:PAS domain S-box-containing protein
MKADRELHHFITAEGRYRILQIILQHTEQLPTAYEIAQFCPETPDDEVRTYLDELVEEGIVRPVTLAAKRRKEGYPETFYGVTDYGWRFLMNHNLLDSEGLVLRWQDIDVDDPTKLAKHESAPRPTDVDIFQGDPVSKTPEQQLEEYKMIVEQTRDALYMLDSEGRYVLVNDAYEDLTGYSREELIGETTSKVLDSDAMAERRELILDLLNEESDRRSHDWQSTLHTADGEQLPVEVNFAALEYDDDFIGIVGSARDISDRRRREQELSVLSRVLRHNLGNKVNIIQGYAEVIEDHVDDESALDYTERIRRTSEKLIQQSEKARDINELLQEWPPEKRPRDVTTVVWDIVTELEMEYLEATLSVDMPDSAWARLPDQFGMAIEEILRNAIDHAGKEDPTVRVGIETPTEDSGDITISIDDDGPGIPEHELKVLSSEEETPLAHSEGIGLWMVTWIIDAADGEITFEESESGGARVRMEFPQAEPPALTLSM